MNKPKSKFSPGDYVRTTEEMAGLACDNVTGVVREATYSQHVNKQTGALVDEWSWGYTVEFGREFSVYIMECFLRKARIDE